LSKLLTEEVYCQLLWTTVYNVIGLPCDLA